MLRKIKYLFRDLPLKSYLIYICVALFLTTGVTFSKYIAGSTAGDSARVATFGTLELTETTPPFGQYIFAPGIPIAKDPKINFSNNEMSAYVFVQITAEYWSFEQIFERFTYRYDLNKLSWEINNTDWKFVSYDNDSKTSVFYKLVPPGETLSDISIIKNDAISVNENIKASDLAGITESQMNIVIKAYAVQSSGFENASSAWESVKNK